MSKKLIQALEPRVMLDGAAVATALDTIDELTQSTKIDEVSENKDNKFKAASDTKLPFVNGIDTSQSAKSRQIVFIDSAVEDIETLINSFDDNAEVHIIQSDQDGFVEIQKILSDESDVDALHIIGHGSVGQIAFGTAVLNSDTLDAYEDTLKAIGLSLSEQGDILFYGCNVATDQNGEVFINLHNIGKGEQVIYPGDKIAQVVLTPVVSFRTREVDRDLYVEPVTISNRGEGALGSTGS